MSEIFADAFYCIALLNPNDQFHSSAMRAALDLDARVVTTIWVLTEVADALSSPSVLKRTVEFISRILADPCITLVSNAGFWFE